MIEKLNNEKQEIPKTKEDIEAMQKSLAVMCIENTQKQNTIQMLTDERNNFKNDIQVKDIKISSLN